MGWREERDEKVLADYAAGRDVAEIERDYGVTEAQITDMVEPTLQPADDRQRPRLTPILLGCLAAAVLIGCVAAIGRHDTSSPVDPAIDAECVCVEEFIPQRLKAPATAEFTAVVAGDGAGVYTVSGGVDAQNSFGALIRNRFVCVVRNAGSQWILQSALVT